jgi:adenine-specific DNA-methyltransferase
MSLQAIRIQTEKTDKQTNRQTDKQTNRQTDKQTNRQTDKQTKQSNRHTSLKSKVRNDESMLI